MQRTLWDPPDKNRHSPDCMTSCSPRGRALTRSSRADVSEIPAPGGQRPDGHVAGPRQRCVEKVPAEFVCLDYGRIRANAVESLAMIDDLAQAGRSPCTPCSAFTW
ncbi:UNVERIFIED_CONTAM: hypothetical protein FKN15_029359 [Acipenser sinensis]